MSTNAENLRASVLDEARKCVCGQREDDYGSPENNFLTIAFMWTQYLRARGDEKASIGPRDVAAMMCLLKIARIASGYKIDNWVDLAGYAACGGELDTSLDVP